MKRKGWTDLSLCDINKGNSVILYVDSYSNLEELSLFSVHKRCVRGWGSSCTLEKKLFVFALWGKNRIWYTCILLTELFFKTLIFVVMGIEPTALYMLGKTLYY